MLGKSNINSMDATIIGRLVARYTSRASNVPKQNPDSNLNLSAPYRIASGARYVKVDGNATIASTYCMGKGSRNSRVNNTLVIDVSGTLNINANIGYGTRAGSTCREDTYTSLAELPQLIVFAGDINIKGNVNYIDAWLVVGQGEQPGRWSGGTGNINTCSDVANWAGLDSTKCNKKLVINGPVITKKLTLNRTAGAGNQPYNGMWSPLTNSIQAAEVFNLRPDAYLWAYNQGQRYSQAVTVYLQEKAPRY